MTTESLLAIFPPVPPLGKGLAGVVDPLFDLAARTDGLELAVPVRDGDTRELVGRVDAEAADWVVLPQGYRRMFRPLLAYIAGTTARETGTEFQPYGGTVTVRRESESGPVDLVITFMNTMGEQWVRFTRVPVGRAPAVNGSHTPAVSIAAAT